MNPTQIPAGILDELLEKTVIINPLVIPFQSPSTFSNWDAIHFPRSWKHFLYSSFVKSDNYTQLLCYGFQDFCGLADAGCYGVCSNTSLCDHPHLFLWRLYWRSTALVWSIGESWLCFFAVWKCQTWSFLLFLSRNMYCYHTSSWVTVHWCWLANHHILYICLL